MVGFLQRKILHSIYFTVNTLKVAKHSTKHFLLLCKTALCKLTDNTETEVQWSQQLIHPQLSWLQAAASDQTTGAVCTFSIWLIFLNFSGSLQVKWPMIQAVAIWRAPSVMTECSIFRDLIIILKVFLLQWWISDQTPSSLNQH